MLVSGWVLPAGDDAEVLYDKLSIVNRKLTEACIIPTKDKCNSNREKLSVSKYRGLTISRPHARRHICSLSIVCSTLSLYNLFTDEDVIATLSEYLYF